MKKTSEPIYVLPYRYVKYFGEKGYLADLSSAFQKEMGLLYPELRKLNVVNVASIKNRESLLKAIKAIEAKTKAKGIGLDWIGLDWLGPIITMFLGWLTSLFMVMAQAW